MDANQLLTIRRRRQAHRFILLRILLIVAAITTSQGVLPFVASRKLSYSVPRYGRSYVIGLLNGPGGYDSRIFRVLRMTRSTFKALVRWMHLNTSLKSSRKGMLLEEKLGMFLYMVGQDAGFRGTAEAFRRSINIVYHVFHEVLRATNALYLQEVRLPTTNTSTAIHVRQNRKFWPYFKDCVEALDGSHVHAHVPGASQGLYRNRKRQLTQNVLVVCDFNMAFT